MQSEFKAPQCSKGLIETVTKIEKSIEFMRKKLKSFDLNDGIIPDPTLGLTSVECPSPPYVRRTSQPTRLERLHKACFDLKTQIAKKDRELKCLKESKNQGFPEILNENQLNHLQQRKDDLEEKGESMKHVIRSQSFKIESYKKKYENLQKTVDDQERYIEKMEEKYKQKEEKMKLDIRLMQEKYTQKLDEVIDCPEALEQGRAEAVQLQMDKKKLLCKILILYNEMQNMKNKKKKPKEDCTKNMELKHCQEDYSRLLKHHQSIMNEKEKLLAELQQTRKDYISHKKGSASNITRMKLHSSCEMQSFIQEIAELEEELNACKEMNCVEKTQRNEVLEDLKEQISSITYIMSSTQTQVHTLKDELNNMPLLAAQAKTIDCQ